MGRARWFTISGLALVLALGVVALQQGTAYPNERLPVTTPGIAAVAGEATVLVPALTGEPELCLTCHAGIEAISPSHAPEVVGCVACHGGDGSALDTGRAHASLRGGRNPSDPSVVMETCGRAGCHGEDGSGEASHVARVLNSLPATFAGSIANVRFAFGLQTSPAAEFGVRAAADPSAGQTQTGLLCLEALPQASERYSVAAKFEENCLNGGCHLSSPGAAMPYFYRGSGCAACHYLYGDDGLYRGGDPTVPRDEAGHGLTHRLTTAIPFSQCNHCHNRGTHSLRQMTFLLRDDLPPASAPLPVETAAEARRLIESYQPIGDFTNCEWELDCVDCHTGREAMGDGHIYQTKKDGLEVECRTCHGTPSAEPEVRVVDDAGDPAVRQAMLAGRASFLAAGDRVVVTALGNPLWSVKQTGHGEFVQLAKVSGELYRIPLVIGSACEQDGEEQGIEYCHQCHVAAR